MIQNNKFVTTVLALTLGLTYCIYDFKDNRRIQEDTVTNYYSTNVPGKNLEPYKIIKIFLENHDRCLFTTNYLFEQISHQEINKGDSLTEIIYHHNHFLSPIGSLDKVAFQNDCDRLINFELKKVK
ncbi:hypothetical protein HQ489_00870 [Candidatus Woesearchaeota archaeon]|nr:hypothetical protein [Candidatus Woesearchaeota archaeon]